ncbi:30S ribosomal protein S13 [Candidatus Woesearchaeota archaeon]|nr:MAG: 30S ribosomal protein S13 [Candidatus Woesearchaeota archaeon]
MTGKPEAKPNTKYLVRIANTDLDGKKRILYAMRKIKGVGIMYANAVLKQAGISPDTITGELTDEEEKRLNEIIREPLKNGIPSWLVNRRKDYETGEDKHLLLADLDFTKENDLKRLKKIKSYRGIRHHLGLPVRGQRTKSNFRKNKGKAMGVTKKGKK